MAYLRSSISFRLVGLLCVWNIFSAEWSSSMTRATSSSSSKWSLIASVSSRSWWVFAHDDWKDMSMSLPRAKNRAAPSDPWFALNYRYRKKVFSSNWSDDRQTSLQLCTSVTVWTCFVEAKKSGADSSSPDDPDINSIDKHQTDEIVIPMPTFFKRRSLFETDVDPDTIQINILADEKPCGSLSLTPEDLRMLVNSLIEVRASLISKF